ncbi:MAG: MarR family transcriptional regulator [Mycoplasmataceae bacterium]|nr:MarR family transcriptional regulator [Mycoplasmataceae bacterium]
MALVKIKHVLRNTKIGAEFNVLSYIIHSSNDKPVTPSQIARHFYMTTPMVAKVIRALLKKKYIVVTIDPNDHRKSHLKLTEAGKQNFKQKIIAIHRWYLSVFDKLSKKDSDMFINLLEKVANLAIANIKVIKNV